MNMKIWMLGALALIITGCSSSVKSAETSAVPSGQMEQKADTMLFVGHKTVDAVPYLILRMNPEEAYVSMADSVIPSESDSEIALCVEAAFTGELSKTFKSTNIGGDYVIEGTFRKGYKCRANSGFLYADGRDVVISTLEDYKTWIEKARKNHGTLFQQILIVHRSKNVYRGFPIKPAMANIYRSACVMADGGFAVIQSQKPLPLRDFISALIDMDVSDALYLDMGTGWNYGWYRQTPASAPTKLFRYRTPYQTNWLLIKSKP